MKAEPLKIEVEGRSIELDRPAKILWSQEPYTVLDVVRYYVAVAPWLLPYLHQRPLVYETYPGTVKGPNTFEQDPPADAPSWVKRVRVAGRERLVTYVVCEHAATLVYLVAQHMVTLHVWESTTQAIENPDFLLFDLDPGERCGVAALAQAALAIREALERQGLYPLVKTSGARGVHVIAPIEPREPFAKVRAWTHSLARELCRTHSGMTAERVPARRPDDAVYVDWGQMGRGMTIVPPYTVRPCPRAPVATPLQWDEVRRLAHSRARKPPIELFSKWNMASVPEQLRLRGDPWAGEWKPRRLAV